MNQKLFIIFFLSLMVHIFYGKGVRAQTPDSKQIIYEYKKYDKVDLGNMEIDGKIVVPADLTVIEQSPALPDQPLYDRQHFYQEMQRELIAI